MTTSHVIRNHLLVGMSKVTLHALLPKLTSVPLTTGQILHASNVDVDKAYFPEAGMISKVARLAEGLQIEVGLVGIEGVAGAFLTGVLPTSFTDSVVQLDGQASRIDVSILSEMADEFPDLRSAILRHGEMMLAQAVQSVCCVARHTLGQRLARWLLMAHDRASSDEMALTQDFIAAFLASYRPNITVAAKVLRIRGAIRYHRGVVTVLDRAILESCACECYSALRDHSDRLTIRPTSSG